MKIDPELNNFIIPATEKADISVRITRDWDDMIVPEFPPSGTDSLCRYYRNNDTWYCLTRGGPGKPVACSIYRDDCRDIRCVINEKPFLHPPGNLGSVLRMIPLRMIFQRFGVLFLHSSRIACKGRAILFSGASGIGKTTQARLWKKYRCAEILCNDRTLLRKTEGIWYTYGYPLDGSEPVHSSDVILLGAVVLLAQGENCTVQRLGAGRATSMLMGQSVIDVWDADARKTAAEIILALLEDIPVFLLTCTPDERAVNVLEEKLVEEEVMTFE